MEAFLRKYFWSFYLLVIAACSLLLAKAASSVLGAGMLRPNYAISATAPSIKPTLAQATKRDISSILRRNIFCFSCDPISLFKPVDAISVKPAIVDRTPQKTTLPLQLVALMPSDDPNWSMAVIRDVGDDRKLCELYKRGSQIRNGQAVVAQVTAQKVYFVVGSRIEYLDDSPVQIAPISPAPLPMMGGNPEMSALEKEFDKGIRCSTPNSCEIDRVLVDKILGNTSSLVTSARIYPAMGRDGKPSGFRITPVGINSVWSKIGVQPGDIIKSINGLDMSSPDKGLEAYAKLKSASHLTLVIERRGEPTSLDYTIR